MHKLFLLPMMLIPMITVAGCIHIDNIEVDEEEFDAFLIEMGETVPKPELLYYNTYNPEDSKLGVTSDVTLSMGDVFEDRTFICQYNPYSEVKRGDIVGFYYNDESVVHRVIYKTEDRFYTKGDANEHIDPWKLDESNYDCTVVGIYEG